MGRELKRVALDFQWEIDKVWEGYLNHYYKHSKDCPFCEGSGNSPEYEELKYKWYGYSDFKPEDRGSVPYNWYHPIITKRAEWNLRDTSYEHYKEDFVRREAKRLASHFNSAWSHHLNQDDVNALVKKGRLTDFVKYDYDKETETYTPVAGAVIPTAQQVNDWSIDFGLGHDSINQWIVTRAEAERLDIESNCKHCDGAGTIWESPDMEIAADEWKPTEPPKGDGYQIWETVSEGSPISPVFATPEELATYMAGRKWGADKGLSYEIWMKFITRCRYTPSMVAIDGVIMSGVEACNAN